MKIILISWRIGRKGSKGVKLESWPSILTEQGKYWQLLKTEKKIKQRIFLEKMI